MEKFRISPEDLEELIKEEKRRYKSEWRKKNKDKVRESNKKYWAKRAMKRFEEEWKEGGEAHD